MSNGKPVKEIIPGLIRKLLIQRKDYLKQQRINRSKKNRDPNQPKLPGMKQGGVMAKKQTSVKDEVKRRMREETPRTGYGVGLSPITHLRRRLHKKQIEKELKDRPEHLSPAKVSNKAKRKFKNGGEMKKAHGGKVKVLSMSKAKDYPGAAKAIKLNKLGLYKKPKPVKKAHGGFVKAAGGTKRVPGSGAATKGTNFEGIF